MIISDKKNISRQLALEDFKMFADSFHFDFPFS